MGSYCLSGRDAMFPFLLRFGMHDQKRIVREMDRYLALHIGAGVWGRGGIFFVVWWDNATDSELSLYT
jgi:hypothetical protein